MAEPTDSITVPTARDDFDLALCQAQTIVEIITHLADADRVYPPGAALYGWLAQELWGRLERIEVAEMTMRQARA